MNNLQQNPDKLQARILPVRLNRNANRVVALPFNIGAVDQIDAIVKSVAALSDRRAARALDNVTARFASRHQNLGQYLEENYRSAAAIIGQANHLPPAKRLLIGAYCTMEFAIEGAALFNPSIVPHPDQSDAPSGGLRFVMSLRAVGEGHLSSTVFQTGTITAQGGVSFDMPEDYSSRPSIHPDKQYNSQLCRRKLDDMGVDPESSSMILKRLGHGFTLGKLHELTAELRRRRPMIGDRLEDALNALRMLANANYDLDLPRETPISSLILFPRSDSERRGIEDMRLVRFTDDDGKATYYGTYTAYDGNHVLPMLMETTDFRRIHVHTLNGACARNKGMALFPRRIKGHYLMCSRIDGRRLFLMYSDMVHFWETATPLAEPRQTWEMRIIGNCGSPIETEYGWLLITHGVGPMRRYSMGAMLLDRKNPAKILGRLRRPLIEPPDSEREGYTPNVVYSCGGLIHNGLLFLPFAVADTATRVATIPLERLIEQILADGP